MNKMGVKNMKFENLKYLLLLVAVLMFSVACQQGDGNSSSDNINGAESEGEEKLDFPKKPIELITPFAAGGISDILARGIAEYGEEYVGETIVVVNREGAGGTIGTAEGAKAKADGYTITLGTAAGFTTQPYLREISYSIEDFKILSSVSFAPNMLAVSADSPYYSIQDIVEASQNDNVTISYGHPGVGSFGDLAQRALFDDLNVKTENIPFEGSNPAIAALLGGHIDVSAVLPTDVVQHVKDDKIRLIATLAPERLDDYPDVPTIGEAVEEAGLEFRYAEHDFSASYFLLVPKDTPDNIAEYLAETFMASLNSEEFTEFAENTDMYLRIEEGEKVFNEIVEQSEIYKTIIDEQGIGDN